MDARTPRRYLWSLIRARRGLTACAVLAGTLWLLSTALLPLIVGKAIDNGVATGHTGELVLWGSVILALGVVQAAAGSAVSWTSHTLWVHGAHGTQAVLARQVTELGATLPKRLRAGELVAMSADDVHAIGTFLETAGRAVGAFVSFALLGVILLGTSPLLGTVVLTGVPLAVVGLGPILRPLRHRKEAQRERLSDVTTMGADIVGGLRILRGIGGERTFFSRFSAASGRVREAGIAVGRLESWLSAAEVALPGLVTVLVTGIGAVLAERGTISVGELVAFYGASAFLVVPVQTATEAAEDYSTAVVAAGRACRLLNLRTDFSEPAEPASLPDGPLELIDGTVRVPAGELTVLPPDRTQAERLTGFAGSAVRIGGIPVEQVSREQLRHRVVLLLGDALWFSGPVGEELALGDAVAVPSAVHAADAEDVIEGFPDGYAEVISERGRSVSGGQRQRLLLAKALTLDPDVLVLDEPTSAVDAHTEARIAARVARLRAGRTTVVLTSSPLWRACAATAQGDRS